MSSETAVVENTANEDAGPFTTSKRMAAGQDPAKRLQILGGARRVFSRMGFDAASMNDITREAGVSKGTIYVYFEDKDELFEALVEEERRTMFGDLYLDLERGSDMQDIAGTLYRHGVALARKVTTPVVVRAQRTVIGICERKPDLGARFYEHGPGIGHDKMTAFLDKAVEAGRLSIPDTDLAAYQFSDLCFAGLLRPMLFHHRKKQPSQDEIEANVRSAVSMFMATYGVADFA